MKKALIIVDIQNDFCPGGALEVAQGDQTVAVANQLIAQGGFDWVVATQDFHPADHKSFAANHLWRKAGQVIELNGLPQVLWNIHCVQGTWGAEFVQGLSTDKIDRVFPKGTDPEIDSYSGFFDNGHRKSTGMGEFLRAEQVGTVYVLGLATDYCVKATAIDALGLGFETFLVEDGCRAVNLQPQDGQKAIEEMQSKGVKLLQSAQILQKNG